MLIGIALLEAEQTDRIDVPDRPGREYVAIMAVPALVPPVGQRGKRDKDWNKGKKP
ncbi:MAG: hypothetical protein V1695_04205 [Candidatus Uhrbacteria bacterium]